MRVPEPEIKPAPPQRQCQILNLLLPSRNSWIFFFFKITIKDTFWEFPSWLLNLILSL